MRETAKLPETTTEETRLSISTREVATLGEVTDIENVDGNGDLNKWHIIVDDQVTADIALALVADMVRAGLATLDAEVTITVHGDAAATRYRFAPPGA